MPFAADSGGFRSTAYSDGSPMRIGAMGFDETAAMDVSGGLTGTVAVPGFAQYGVTAPVNCILDAICLTVGNPAFVPASGQTMYAFAMLATANGNSQQFTLHPETKAEVLFEGGESYPAQVKTVRWAGMGFVLAAETRYMVVCGHYATGDIGSTSYTFTYAGTLLFK